MKANIRLLALYSLQKKIDVDRLKSLEAPSEMILSAEEASEIAISEFNHYAVVLGMDEEQKSRLLQEKAEYLKARSYLADMFQYLPSSRLFKKFLGYGRGWSFAGVAVDLSTEDEDIYENELNYMTVAELEEFLDNNPEPDQAMHALGIIANHVHEWSQSVLVEFKLLADRVRKWEEKNIPKERVIEMINELLSQIEDDLEE